MQLHPFLPEICNNILPLRANNPLRKPLRHILIQSPPPNQDMRRIQQRISRVISAHLIDDRLILQAPRNRKIRPPIRDGILLQQDRSCERLDRIRDVLMIPGRVPRFPGDLSNLKPQLGLFDISSRTCRTRLKSRCLFGLRCARRVDCM